MRALGQYEWDEQPLRDVPSPAGKVVDRRDKKEGDSLDTEEDPLCRTLTAMRGEKVVEGLVDVEVESGVSALSAGRLETMTA